MSFSDTIITHLEIIAAKKRTIGGLSTRTVVTLTESNTLSGACDWQRIVDNARYRICTSGAKSGDKTCLASWIGRIALFDEIGSKLVEPAVAARRVRAVELAVGVVRVGAAVVALLASIEDAVTAD